MILAVNFGRIQCRNVSAVVTAVCAACSGTITLICRNRLGLLTGKQGRKSHGNLRDVSDQSQGDQECRNVWHAGLRQLQHWDLGHARCHKQVDAHRRSYHTDCQVTGHDDTKVYRINSCCGCDRNHDRG